MLVPTAVAFELASVEPEDLPGDWWYGSVTESMPRFSAIPCNPDREDTSLGALYVWMVNEATERSFLQSLTAMPATSAGDLRALMEKDAAACNGDTEKTLRGALIVHVSVEPFTEHGELGDDALLTWFETENASTGEHLATHSAYVRYGGLVSGITLLQPSPTRHEDAHTELEPFVRAAHARTQTAAWYLRD